jgi:uroporphyrin-III C-methyltransferase
MTTMDAPATPSPTPSRLKAYALPVLVLALLLAVVIMWQKLEHAQNQLARASTDATSFAMEARASAKNAQDTVRELSTRLGVTESRIAEVSLQRTQLEELMQSLSRSRDENMIIDIDSALRLAQQQSQMLGSTEPVLAALRAAEQRIRRAAQPRLAPVARAIAKDMDRLKTARILDIGQASLSLDEVARMVDEMPLAQDPPALTPSTPRAVTATTVSAMLGWGERFWQEVRGLVRVSKIDSADAALLSPSQGFFVRENLKLRLLNARIGLMSRQLAGASADLKSSQQNLARYFDPNAKTVQVARERIAQIQSLLLNSELPRLDDTLAALATMAGQTGK